jgi:cytosine/adenosine deaminase-related metal-dependent hydrolase
MATWLLTNTHMGRDVLVRGDRLADASSLPPGLVPKRFDCGGGTVEPGRINAHTHLYSGLAPLGMPQPLSPPQNFLQILKQIWWRLDRALDGESLRAAARYYVAQALRFGTTFLVDHHESPDMIAGSLDILADACEELGVRALLAYGATERNGGLRESSAGLQECRRFIRTNRRKGVQGLFGLHASFTVSDSTLENAGQLCRELAVPMHVHVAEDVADLEDAQQRGYSDPLDRLLKWGVLPTGSILAHGVHLDRDAVRRCNDLGLWLVQNPRSNAGNRVGYPRALSHSRFVAIGTDGYPASMPDEEAALLELARKETEHEDPRSVSVRATAGYALVTSHLRLPFGDLLPGSAADLVVRSTSGSILHVMCQGQWVVQNGELLTANFAEIEQDAKVQAQRLWSKMSVL